jgi:hypothetical protein
MLIRVDAAASPSRGLLSYRLCPPSAAGAVRHGGPDRPRTVRRRAHHPRSPRFNGFLTSPTYRLAPAGPHRQVLPGCKSRNVVKGGETVSNEERFLVGRDAEDDHTKW